MTNRDELYNDLEEAVRLALDGRQATIWSAIPGIVKSVDFDTMTVSVQPSIQGTIELPDGTTQGVNLPLLINVPICFPKAGGFVLTLPIAIDDEVLIVFAARCIDSWWQNGGIGRPMEARMHDLSDGFCIPGPCSVPKVIPNISTTGAQLRNEAGDTFVEISADGKVKITSSEKIQISGPTELTGDVTITGDVAVTGKLSTTGNVEAGAKVKAATSVEAIGDVKAGIISLTTHVHGGVTSGGATTGPAV